MWKYNSVESVIDREIDEEENLLEIELELTRIIRRLGSPSPGCRGGL